MAGRSLQELLDSEYLIRQVSRFKLPQTTLANLFGWGLGNRDPNTDLNPQGANAEDSPLREGKYDVFNSSQEVADGSVPGGAMNRRAPQVVGSVDYKLPRHTESIELSYERLNQMRQIGQSRNIVDSRGQKYVEFQTRYLAQLFSNLLEAQTAGMIRGGMSFVQQGDRLRFSLDMSIGNPIDYQIPAGNKDQLDMLGAGNIIGASWATASTDIPLDLMQINDAMIALTGVGISHMVCGNDVWNYVINNDKVKAQHGTSSQPYEILQRIQSGEFTASLKSFPGLTIHIVDYRIKHWNGSAIVQEKLIEPDHVAFFPNPESSWCQYTNGMETIKEGINGPIGDRFGFYPYAYETHNPDGYTLAARHNGLPFLYVPAMIAYADVTP